MITPALRMRNEPMMKIMSNLVDGHPPEARANDHSVGKSRSKVPVWLESLMRLEKAFKPGVKVGSVESQGWGVGITV